MHEGDGTASSGKRKKPRWDRVSTAENLVVFEQGGPKLSQREFASQSGVPRSTLQHWLSRKAGLSTDPAVAAFFESPSGLAFVHRLVAAAHVAFEQVGPCGVRQVSLFLRLSRLDRVVAASVGSQQQVSRAVEQLIVEFGQSERGRLAKDMPHRRISVCEDETFHPETCLVSIEPVSGFLLLERYSEKRDEKSWTEAMEQATGDLDIEIIQTISDEAKGLLCHAREGLGAHHGPDLFHVQHDLSKGTALPLARRVERASKHLEKARAEVQRHCEQPPSDSTDPQTATTSEPPSPCPASAREAEEQAARALEEAQMLRSETQQAIRAIGQSYHPVHLEDGLVRSPEQLEQELVEQFDRIEGAAVLGEISEASFAHITKARRLIDSMKATLAFFLLRMRLTVAELGLSTELDSLVHQSLFPGLYLQSAASKAPGAGRRQELRRKAEELLAVARAADGPLASLPEAERKRIEVAVQGCVELFQRSSSCVEGRNGQLSLRHHSLHRLSERKLTVLTTIHNYFLRRPDGTTAAERFFRARPHDLFEWVLDRLEIPARPARVRSRSALKAS
jgi:uncharacterized protein DUF6399